MLPQGMSLGREVGKEDPGTISSLTLTLSPWGEGISLFEQRMSNDRQQVTNLDLLDKKRYNVFINLRRDKE